ncbi:hypothetical protein D9757_007384 [Collybiopsis confluens]|uniref:non-specific serine/threonine protein kinase n=1 Tax=Collybiopsis confluens TaxID=2823264 RepID=A0A8H5HJ23_9AGAR|nr:hypothetical protein D9757_007384 [Collybiopsis confluens]
MNGLNTGQGGKPTFYMSSSPPKSYSPSSEDEEDWEDYVKGGYHPVHIGNTFSDGRYVVVRKLGWGHFTFNYLCDRMNRHVALKIVKSAPRYTQSALDEIKLLQRIITSSTPPQSQPPGSPLSPSQIHPGRSHVISFLDHFRHHGPNGTHVCMVFEVLGESLLPLIKRHITKGVPMNLVRQIAKQILLGLDYMHRCCGIIHTDLKPENVLIVIDNVEAVINAELEKSKVDEPVQGFSNQRIIGVPASADRGGNWTPLSDITSSHPLPSPASSPGTPGFLANLANSSGSLPKSNYSTSNPGQFSITNDALASVEASLSAMIHSEEAPPEAEEHITVKIADLGNATWAERHFTDKIQTRQYRAPEIILGAEWGTSVDMWSLACVLFELITGGDLLFDTASARDYSEDDDHIAQIIELNGALPLSFTKFAKHSAEFFTTQGDLRHISKLRFWPLGSVLSEKYCLTAPVVETLVGFLDPMLSSSPDMRAGAKDMLIFGGRLSIDSTPPQGQEDDGDNDFPLITVEAAMAVTANALGLPTSYSLEKMYLSLLPTASSSSRPPHESTHRTLSSSSQSSIALAPSIKNLDAPGAGWLANIVVQGEVDVLEKMRRMKLRRERQATGESSASRDGASELLKEDQSLSRTNAFPNLDADDAEAPGSSPSPLTELSTALLSLDATLTSPGTPSLGHTTTPSSLISTEHAERRNTLVKSSSSPVTALLNDVKSTVSNVTSQEQAEVDAMKPVDEGDLDDLTEFIAPLSESPTPGHQSDGEDGGGRAGVPIARAKDVPLGTLQLGQGVDALTGQALSHALASFKEPTPKDGSTCSRLSHVIEQFHQLNTDIEIGENVTVNIGTPSVSAIETAKIIKSETSSDKKFTIECRVVGQYEYDQLDLKDLQLNSEAQKTLDKSIDDFRRKYGDYFVAGYRRRYRSYMVAVCETTEKSKTTDAQLEARAKFQDFLNAGANAERSTVDSDKYKVFRTYISQYGCHSVLPAPGQQFSLLSIPSKITLESALDALKEASSKPPQYHGIPKEAVLWHYSLLPGVSGMDREIGVPPKIFAELHDAETDCAKLDLDCFHPALDMYATVQRDAQQAIRTFRDTRSVLAGDDKRRKEAVVGIKKAVGVVNNIIGRYELVESLLILDDEPGIGKKVVVGGQGAAGRLSYGEVHTVSDRRQKRGAYPVTLRNGLPAFEVNLLWEKADVSRWDKLWIFGHKKTTLKLEKRSRASEDQGPSSQKAHHWQRNDFYIVGWTITYDSPTGSSDFRVNYGGILRNNLGITVNGWPWRCRIVYILKEDYKFRKLTDQSESTSLEA